MKCTNHKFIGMLYVKGENDMSKENEALKSDEVEYDPDASQETWNECYKKIYTSSKWGFWGMFNYDNLKRYCGKVCRFYAPIIINKKYPQFNKYTKFEMSGDTDFNFGKSKGNTPKYEAFEKLLRRDYQGEKLTDHLKKLDQCFDRYHKFENFSFMPITGSLQLIKGACQYDRLDMFVYKLSIYYETDTLNPKYRNREALETYLNLFDGIYDYCEKIYMINSKEFVNEIIAQGKELIDSGARVVRYMELAEKFWDNKKQTLKYA